MATPIQNDPPMANPWFSQLFTSWDFVTKNRAGQTGSWQKAAGRRGSRRVDEVSILCGLNALNRFMM